MSGKSDNELVDYFVQYLNQTGFDPKEPDEVPAGLDLEDGEGEWRIVRASYNPWVTELVEKLPGPFPNVYLSFISRYRFCSFEVGPVTFFANTGQSMAQELATKQFADSGLYPTLHKHSYLQFGKANEANYDPICFAVGRQKSGDAPIVQLDHEAILLHERIRIVEEIAPSCSAFMLRAIAEKFPVT